MYRYSNCRHPYPHRITGDGHQTLMNGLSRLPVVKEISTPWTEDEVDWVRELYGKNLTLAYIAEMLERSLNSVKHKVRQLKLHRPNIQTFLSAKRKEYIRRHYPVRGLDYCSKHLGLAKKTVCNYVHQIDFGGENV